MVPDSLMPRGGEGVNRSLRPRRRTRQERCQSQGRPSQPGLTDPHRPLGGRMGVSEFKEEEKVGYTKTEQIKAKPWSRSEYLLTLVCIFIQEGSLGGR